MLSPSTSRPEIDLPRSEGTTTGVAPCGGGTASEGGDLASDTRAGTLPYGDEVIDLLVDPEQLRPAYQPIVDLGTGAVVAFEALARWPRLGYSPADVFARAGHRITDVDRACRLAAIRGAIDAGLSDRQHLFVNVEPLALGCLVREASSWLFEQDLRRLRVTLELTERALSSDPAGLMSVIALARRRGIGIALDDVGADPSALALLPLVSPDVVKLDLGLVRAWPGPTQSRVIAGVQAYAEQSCALVLAEGIETRGHLEQAIALGATLGQGWYFGRPGPLISSDLPGKIAFESMEAERLVESPFSLVEANSRVRVARKGLLLGIARHVEDRAFQMVAPVVFAALQDYARLTPPVKARYEAMSRKSPLVATFGTGKPGHDGAAISPAGPVGMRWVELSRTDPMRLEWSVVVVGAQESFALLASDLGDDSPDLQRRFRYVLTHDRNIVTAAARSMAARISPPAADCHEPS